MVDCRSQEFRSACLWTTHSELQGMKLNQNGRSFLDMNYNAWSLRYGILSLNFVQAEFEAFIKAEAEAARLEKESSEKQAEEIKKKAETAAIQKAEKELADKIRAEKLNEEINEKHRLAQEKANEKFLEAKKRLEDTGAEFVSNEEFDKIKAQNKAAGAAQKFYPES